MLINYTALNVRTLQGQYFAANTSGGGAVTPGNGSKGAWLQMAPATYSPKDVIGLMIFVGSGSTAATSRPTILDIGVDPAGGTSYTTLISNIQVGGAIAYYVGAQRFFFPISVKGGSAIAFRAQSTVTTSIRVAACIFMSPSSPVMTWTGAYSETIGYTTGSLGTTFVPGNAAKGSWVSLGTTTKNLKYFQLSMHCNNTVVPDTLVYADLAYGDGTNFTTILHNVVIAQHVTSEQFHTQLLPTEACFRDVPAGSTLYVRGACDQSPVTGWHAIAIGIGG